MAVAVKELVENAIDAGATLIEVKLKEQGLQGVEVCDNGSGVEEANLEGMSKLCELSKVLSLTLVVPGSCQVSHIQDTRICRSAGCGNVWISWRSAELPLRTL